MILLAQADFRLGFKGHPLFATLKPNSDYHSSASTRIGFSYGVMFDYYMQENYAFSSEFAITSMGGKVEYSRADTTIASDVRLRYIEIPLTLKLRSNEIADNIKIYGRFGVSLAINVKATAELEYLKGNANYANDDIKKAGTYVQPINTSLVIGGGVEYAVGDNLDIIAGITYSGGFMNVMKNKSMYNRQANTNISAFGANANYIAINLGLMF